MSESLTEEEQIMRSLKSKLYGLPFDCDNSDDIAEYIKELIDLRVKRALDKYHEETQVITVSVSDLEKHDPIAWPASTNGT